MDIEKIKELALANGFKLKEQANGNMDLNAYVYDFANAIEQAAKADTDDQITVSYERLQELIEIGVKAALKAQAVPDGFVIGRLQDRIVELLDERQELYAQLDAGCTEGFVLVPKEPTPKMIDAMDEFDCRNDYADMYNAYKAMIEAQEQSHE